MIRNFRDFLIEFRAVLTRVGFDESPPIYTHIHAHVCLLVQCAGGVVSRLFVRSTSSPIQLFYPLVTFFWVGWYDWASVAGLAWCCWV